ncbi:hypothetical protein PCE1_002737 [Barthelona sp. PCE]
MDTDTPNTSTTEVVESEEPKRQIRLYDAAEKESKRQIEERDMLEKERVEREHRLKENVEQSTLARSTLALQWSNIVDIDDCDELKKALEQQKEACSNIIDRKNDLIKDFENLIARKDQEYVTLLKRQKEEIEQLRHDLHQDFKHTLDENRLKLEDLDLELDTKFKTTIKTNSKELEAVLEHRRSVEENFVNTKLRQLEEDEDLLNTLKQQQAEETHELKMRYWRDIQEQDLEIGKMRTVYQLNSEKLEFNHAVLMSQTAENDSLILHQKRKISRLRDHLHSLQNQVEEKTQDFQSRLSKITSNYEKSTLDFNQSQKKFLFFLKTNDEKFTKLWNYNEKKLFKKIQKTLVIDRLIHEQQLNLKWDAPDESVFKNRPSNLEPKKVFDENNPEDVDISDQPNFWEQVYVFDFEAVNVLELLWIEGRYLLCSDALEQVLAIDDAAKQAVEKKKLFKHEMAQLLNVLSVKTLNDLKALVSALKVKRAKPKANHSVLDKGLGPEEFEYVLASRNEILGLLKRFLERQNEKNRETKVKKLDRLLQNTLQSKASMYQKEELQEEARIWDSHSSIISESKLALWRLLKKAFENYNEELKARSELYNKVDTLKNENNELKLLINQYLASDIAEDLLVPPTVGHNM